MATAFLGTEECERDSADLEQEHLLTAGVSVGGGVG